MPLYAVVDVETTGGSAARDRIIEIGIVITDGEEILDTFHELINPEIHVPGFITSLTGINDALLTDAPVFKNVSDEVIEKLIDKVFVAHNVNFDYGFVKNELSRAGHEWNEKRICTARLARKLFPNLRSYGLGKLCDHFGIIQQNKHRALDDALAATQLLHHFIANDESDNVSEALNSRANRFVLPAAISTEMYESLPQATGIYYFKDARRRVLYVGKAKNIKSRVYGHFTSESSKEKDLIYQNLDSIGYTLTGNELVAELLESAEIRKHWPVYNKAQKFTLSNVSIVKYTDRKGYLRLATSTTNDNGSSVSSFMTLQQARDYLKMLIEKYSLCPKLSGLQRKQGACTYVSVGKCDGACIGKVSTEEYNQRIQNAIASESGNTYCIIGNGIHMHEKSLVLVEKGRYRGFGYISGNVEELNLGVVKQTIDWFEDNQDTQKIINKYLLKDQCKVIHLQ